MLPPCFSSLVSCSHSYDETITNRHPRNDAPALLSPPSVVLRKGGRGNAVAKARCLSLVHASAENREPSSFFHKGGGRLHQGDVFRYTIPTSEVSIAWSYCHSRTPTSRIRHLRWKLQDSSHLSLPLLIGLRCSSPSSTS